MKDLKDLSKPQMIFRNIGEPNDDQDMLEEALEDEFNIEFIENKEVAKILWSLLGLTVLVIGLLVYLFLR